MSDAAMRLIEMQETIDGQAFEIAELRRKFANLIRPGTVKSFDPEKNTVVADVGLETHDIPGPNHDGTSKSWHPFKAGQQITLFCPDGDIANAVVFPGGFHSGSPAPSKSADEDIALQRGSDEKPVRFRTTDKLAAIENKAGNTSVTADDDLVTIDGGKKIVLKADDIVLIGNIKLGGEDASKPASMQGTTDTGGYADTSNLSTKVLVK